MKRTWIRRGGCGLQRRKRFGKRGPRTVKSGGHLFYKSGRDPQHLAALRELPCCFCVAAGLRQRSRTEVEHLKTRGAGGADRGNTVPTCARHREERDQLGFQTFVRKYRALGLDVWVLAAELGRMEWAA